MRRGARPLSERSERKGGGLRDDRRAELGQRPSINRAEKTLRRSQWHTPSRVLPVPCSLFPSPYPTATASLAGMYGRTKSDRLRCVRLRSIRARVGRSARYAAATSSVKSALRV